MSRTLTPVNAADVQAELDAANIAAAQAAVGCVPLHAASVETAAGVIAFAGQSHSGKSTLAAAAVLAGYPYVADEITAVSPDDLSVRPFHRPIGLRRGGAGAIGVDYPTAPDDRYQFVYPWDVGEGHARSAGGTLAGIALVAWGASAEPAIGEVSPALALTQLTQHAVVHDEIYGPAFNGLNRIVRAVPIVTMTYSTTAQSLELLALLVERWQT